MISVRGAWGQVRSLRFGSTFFVRQSQTAVAFPGAFLCFGLRNSITKEPMTVMNKSNHRLNPTSKAPIAVNTALIKPSI